MQKSQRTPADGGKTTLERHGIEHFRAAGRAGGLKCLITLTPEQRSERASKAANTLLRRYGQGYFSAMRRVYKMSDEHKKKIAAGLKRYHLEHPTSPRPIDRVFGNGGGLTAFEKQLVLEGDYDMLIPEVEEIDTYDKDGPMTAKVAKTWNHSKAGRKPNKMKQWLEA